MQERVGGGREGERVTVRLTLKPGVMVHLFLAGYISNALHGYLPNKTLSAKST